MSAQLTFGLMSGETKQAPYAAGQIVVCKGERFVIEAVEPEAYARPALILVSLVDGLQAIRFENEVDYRAVARRRSRLGHSRHTCVTPRT